MEKNKELDKILNILSFGQSIEKIYKKLATLEKKGLQDSEEYKELADLINSCVNIETKKYKDIENFYSKDIEEIKDLIYSLNREQNLTEDTLLDILDVNQKSNNLKRLYFRLRDYALLRNEQYEEEQPIEEENNEENGYKVIEMFGLRFKIPAAQANALTGKNNNSNEDQEQKRQEEIENSRIVNDLIYYKYGYINSLFMQLLLEEINKCKNKTIKNKLIDYKYQLLFITSTMETSFSKNPSNFANPYYYETLIKFGQQYHPDEYDYTYTKVLEMETHEIISEISQANYNKSLATTDEKVKVILKNLYAKALTLAIIDENSREYIDQVQGAARFEHVSNDDLENLNMIIEDGKTLAKRKNVD